MAISTMPPFPIFFDAEGDPLEDGQIFIGVAGLDPEANPIPTYWDAALTQLAPQPIPTSGGYMVNIGTPAIVYVDAIDYSITVRDRNGVFIYNSPNVLLRIGGVEIGGPIISSDAVSFIAAGAGAVIRTATSKLRDWVSVKDFGAVGDGIADDTPAFLAAVAAARCIYIPEPTIGYKITGKITLPIGTALFGINSEKTRILRNGNFVLFEMGTSSSLSGLNIDDLGVSYAASMVEILGSTLGQSIFNCRFVNSPGAGSFIFFDVNAGDNFKLTDCNMGTKTGTDQAVRFSSIGVGAIRSRMFTNLTTLGRGFDFGNAVGVEVTGGNFGVCVYTASTSQVGLVGCWRVNVPTLSGSFNRIVGCTLVADLTISSGTTDCAVTGNTMLSGVEIINLSNNSTNTVDQKLGTYTPVIRTGASTITLGNGTLTGKFSLQGALCYFSIFFQAGSTTVFPGGEFTFTLPIRAADDFAFPNHTIFRDASTSNIYWYTANITDSVVRDRINLFYFPANPTLSTSLPVSAGTPVLVVNGDFFSISGTYPVGG